MTIEFPEMWGNPITEVLVSEIHGRSLNSFDWGTYWNYVFTPLRCHILSGLVDIHRFLQNAPKGKGGHIELMYERQRPASLSYCVSEVVTVSTLRRLEGNIQLRLDIPIVNSLKATVGTLVEVRSLKT